jgi:hypothetical protein
MRIEIQEIDTALKEVFDDLEAFDISTVYEQIENSSNLKLVMFLNKSFYKDTLILYTKFIFTVDEDKMYLTKNSFLYLYDINCEYRAVEFEDLDDFKKQIKQIFKKKLFGRTLKILSDFIKSPATIINDWLADNKVENISVYGFNYDPKVKIIPCKYLSFAFNININNSHEVELIITKENDGLFNFDFRILEQTVSVEKANLNSLVQTIGYFLKDNIK